MSELEHVRYCLKHLTIPARFTPPDAAVMVGRVASGKAGIAVGKFLLVNPVSVLGAETEGAAGLTLADPTVTIPVYLNGPGLPQTGDLLVCRFVDYRWVAVRKGSTVLSNPCKATWPRVLSFAGSVSQAQSSFYFANRAISLPEPVYTLNYGARPSAIPQTLQLEYFQQPSGISPPYYTTLPDKAWWSAPIPVLLFSNPTNCYFYLCFKGCVANVMVIDAPYSRLPDGSPLTEGAGNKVGTYIVTQLGSATTPFQMSPGPFPPVVIWGDHGTDDVTPDAQGGAGYPTAVRTGP